MLLAVLLVTAAFPAGALAQEGAIASDGAGTVYQWGDGETGFSLRETQDTLGGGELGVTSAQTFQAPLGSYDDGSLYGQLTTRQKACYNALASITLEQILAADDTDGYRQVKAQVEGLSGLTLTGTIRDYAFSPDSASKALYRGLYTDICAAITALRYDKPEALWLSDMRYGVSWTSSGSSSVVTKEAIFAFRLKYDGDELEMYNRQMASARALANRVDQSADLYRQVMQVHDLLAAQSTYNYEALEQVGTKAESLSHQAYSCLVAGDPYEPVCDGYAKAVKVVCDLLEIPCVLVSSDTHMWNNVKMDDGDWYNLDLTWDDTGDTGSHLYFLVGSMTVVDGQMFCQQPDHLEKNPWVPDADLDTVNFRYPTKNTDAYVYQPGGYEPLRFPDVKRSAWYYSYVEEAADMGLFAGDEKGFFGPENNITRAQFVQVLFNALAPEDYVPQASPFIDVKDSDWFAAAVSWAGEQKVVSGYEDGTFRPNAPITREEMCVILVNYVNRTLVPNAPETDGFAFPDDGSISSWAKEAVYWCQGNSLVSGDETGRFNPVDYTRRCEAASVFVRYVKLVETFPPAPPEEEPQEPPESSTPEEGDSSSESTPQEPQEGSEEPSGEGDTSAEGQPDENGQEQPSDGVTGEALENTNEPTLKA